MRRRCRAGNTRLLIARHAGVPRLWRRPERREAEHESGEPDDREEVDGEPGALQGTEKAALSHLGTAGPDASRGAVGHYAHQVVFHIGAESGAPTHGRPSREEQHAATDNDKTYQDGDEELAHRDALKK